MMERSSKFLSLSGWAGIMAGIYALVGAYVAYRLFYFSPGDNALEPGTFTPAIVNAILVAVAVLVLAVGTAIYLSYQRANKRREKFWNPISKRLLINMCVPLVTGGILILIIVAKGMIGLVAPFTLIFYGLALYNASKYTYEEVGTFGLLEIGLGLLSAYFVEYGLLFWAIGFGLLHIVYGIYLHYKYER
jgi:hypothetical protein